MVMDASDWESEFPGGTLNLFMERAEAAADSLTGVGAQVITLEPGREASVEMVEGPHGERTMVYGIPRGERGETGSKGETGPQGPAGGVNSVNGKTGEVLLEAYDVGAMPSAGGTFTGQISAPGAEFTAPPEYRIRRHRGERRGRGAGQPGHNAGQHRGAVQIRRYGDRQYNRWDGHQ